MDNRAAFFRQWLIEAAGYTDFGLARMNVKQARVVLATYLDARAKYERGQLGKPPAPKTLTGYLNAAHLYLQHVTGLDFSIRSR